MTESNPDVFWVFAGAYTRREPHVDGKSKGIHVLRFDTALGELRPLFDIPGLDNPSYVALHPQGQFLYAVNEISDYQGKAAGAVSAYRVDPAAGSFELLNEQSTHGGSPSYITVDREGRHVLVSNYGGGSAAVLPVRSDGSLGSVSDLVHHQGSSVHLPRQDAPHPHSINLDPEERYAFVPDLGIDKVMIYRYDGENGKLLANNEQPWARVKSGAGPRHLAFHPRAGFAYVINELDSTISAYRRDSEKGTLTELQTVSTLPEGFQGRNTCADIHVHPSGRFVYGSNRGHDSIAVFAFDEKSGHLSLREHVSTQGSCPRGFALDPSGRYLLAANQNSDTIVVFSIDAKSGAVRPTGVRAEASTPVCIKLLAAHRD
ncbi:MAG: lactonase family protein [Chloroflexota bacterium]|nr:lactonase family protein [Chloroflexota bacterium]